MKPKIFFNILTFLLILFSPAAVFGQEADDIFIDPAQNKIDSLLSRAKNADDDSVKAGSYTQIAFITSSVDTTIKYARLSLQYCKETDTLLKARDYDYLGFAYWMQDESRTALSYLFEAVDLCKKLKKTKAAAHTFLIIGSCYEDLNIRDSIFPYYNMAIKYYVEAQDTANLIIAYNGLGRIYDNMSLYDNAEETYRKALSYASNANDTINTAWCYNNIGNAMGSKSEMDSAIANLRKSVFLFETISYINYDDIQYKYDAYANLAHIYIKAAKLTNKKEYADSCYKYVKKVGNYYLSIGADYDYISHCYAFIDYLIFYKRYNNALKELLKLETLITANSSISVLKNYNDYLYQVYSLLGDYKNALKHHEKLLEYRLSTLNDSTLDIIKNSEVERTRMLEEVKRENAEKLHAVETDRFKSERNMMIVIIVALIAGLLLIFIIVWDKHKANKILSTKNQLLNSQKAEIEAQRDEIESQKNIITDQWNEVNSVNSKLISSINYAERIQRAAVSKIEEVKAVFPESFVFYRPRDIVSGDFYRAGKCGKYPFIVTADCTGHGIPGAFLSMLGISALKEFLVSEYDAENPGTVLDRIREFIKTTLTSSLQDGYVSDGMDMTICCFDFEKMEMHYAIANQTAFIIRKGKSIKLKGDNMPVGRYIIEKEHFQTLTIKIEKDDMVYTFSDGIQDQLGSMKRKFLIQTLLDTLISFAEKPADYQCKILEKTILDWQGDMLQVDDMTLVGIRVN